VQNSPALPGVFLRRGRKPHPAHGASGGVAIVFADDIGRRSPAPYAAGQRGMLARGIRGRLAIARRRGGGGVVPGRRTLARRAGFYLEYPDHGRTAGDRSDAAPDAGPHETCEFPHSAAADAAALGQPRRHIRRTFAFAGNAAPTNLMESGTNGAATIIGNSRQNLGNLEC